MRLIPFSSAFATAGPDGDTNWDGVVDIDNTAQVAQWWLIDCSP